jgi:hypothetical protein
MDFIRHRPKSQQENIKKPEALYFMPPFVL